MMNVVIVLLGVLFGFALSRSGAADYDQIQAMFLLESFQLYGIIGTAVLVVAPGLWVIKRHGKTVTGAPISFKRKVRHRGNIIGGVTFGIGWAITGMCPGPVLVNVGEGKLYAIGALAGVLAGTWLLGVVYERLEAPLRMPALDVVPKGR